MHTISGVLGEKSILPEHENDRITHNDFIKPCMLYVVSKTCMFA